MPVSQELRDPQLIELETQIRACIRDAVNRSTRKPLSWGGLSGYRQLEAIAQALQSLPLQEVGTEYLRQLATQVERTLKNNHWLAQDLEVAHDWLGMIAQCLRFPVRQHTERRTALLDHLSPLTPTSVVDVSKCNLFPPPLAQAPHDARLGYASTI